ELNIISPKVFGDTIGLHPLVIIIAILVGFKVGGVFGGIFSVPIAGVLAIIPEFWLMERKKLEKG
ncbi:MAG: AI-2E family transporter, partial [bacterium]